MHPLQRATLRLCGILLTLLLAACGGQTSGGSGGGGGGGGGTTPSFTLSLSLTSLTVQQGGSGSTTLTVTPQNGFTGAVNLALVDGSGNPVSGINLSPASVTVSGTSPVTQNLTLTVGSSVATGPYALQVRGSSGSLTQQVGLSLTVSAPGGGGGSPSQVTVKVLDPSGSGYTGYYQDSNQNTWQPLNFTNSQATFNVSGSRYGVAVVCGSSESAGSTQFVLATVRESNLATVSCYAYGAPSAGPTITVTVDASQIASVVAPGDEVLVNDSYPPSTLNSALKSIVSYQKSTSGAVDLAVQIRQANRGPTKAVKVVRNVTSSNPTITFVPSDLTNAQSVALTNPPPASFSQYVGYGYITASNTGIADLRVSNNSYLPVAGFQSGDRYISFTEAVQGDYFTDGDGQRAITFKGYTTPPTSVAFATPWSTGALSSNAAGLPQISGLSYPGAIAYGVSYSTPSGRSLSVLVSSGYLAGATSFDLASLSPLLNSVGYTIPSSGTNAVVEVSALVSPMGLRRSLEFISFFGTPTSLPLFTSDLDIQLVNVNKKYVVGGGTVSFP